MTPPPYPPGVEDALRTAWCLREGVIIQQMTDHGMLTGRLVPMCIRWIEGEWIATGLDFGFGHPMGTDINRSPEWSDRTRAAVDALPEYQAWRASIDKKEGE